MKTASPVASPLADRMRPNHLDEFFGQQHLVATGRSLRRALDSGQLHSMVLWGPPGTGKTTLARLMVDHHGRTELVQLSAVLSGVKDIRTAIDLAKKRRDLEDRGTVLFVDEVHRFNKAQQDAFLPFVEDGTVIFIGATTENPSFELNNALLSRARTYVLKSLTENDLLAIVERALKDREHGLGELDIEMPVETKKRLCEAADGDARRLLNLLEIAADLGEPDPDGRVRIGEAVLNEVVTGGLRRFDKGGEAFYDQISALHKSVRGSDPDASLYWLCRMLDGGCDPVYLARRIVRMASEDIGNADPRALEISLNAWDAQERLGSPEGELAMAQAVVFLASAAKSNAVYTAYKAAMQDARKRGSLEVPMHLRNAPTGLMKELGYGAGYRYAHDEPEGFAAGERYFPDEMPPTRYYFPVDRGLEQKIRAKLDRLREANRLAKREPVQT